MVFPFQTSPQDEGHVPPRGNINLFPARNLFQNVLHNAEPFTIYFEIESPSTKYVPIYNGGGVPNRRPYLPLLSCDV